MPNGYREVATPRQVRRYFMNQHGLVDKVVDGGQAVLSTYDAQGHQLSEIDAVGAVTTFERDGRGRITKRIDPLGRVTVFERDTSGLVQRLVDPAGGTTEIERDARGLPLTLTNPLGAVTRYVYDQQGMLVEAQDAAGGVRRVERDGHGNVVRLIEQGGGVWQYAYDFFGRRTAVRAPTGATLSYRHSSRDELLALTMPDNAVLHFRYDGEGHMIERLDPTGHRVSAAWGGFHVPCVTTDEIGRSVHLRYDRDGNLIEVVNASGERHRFVRDMRGDTTEEQTFDAHAIKYRFDAAGRLTRIESASGDVTEQEHNAAGEMVRRSFNGAVVEEFTYDARGLLVSVKSAEAALSFERDATGRIVREIQEVEGEIFSVDVRYDVTGRRVERKTSRGHRVELVRDAQGDVSAARLDGAEVLRFERDGLGRETARILAGGGRIDSDFDLSGRLMRRAVSSGAPPAASGAGASEFRVTADTAYRYDPLGDLTETWDAAWGRTRYDRDPAGRLLAAISDSLPEEVFGYDAVDNLFERGEGASLRTYGASNRLLTRGDTTYAWDGDGRIVAKHRTTERGEVETWKYAWNARGLLYRVERPDGRVIEYRYDAFARRVGKHIFDREQADAPLRLVSSTRFYWDRHVPVHEITTRPGGTDDPVVEERTYAFYDGSFVPLAQRDKGARWAHCYNDLLGTPDRLIDARGEVVGELRRSAHGKVLEERGEVKTPLRGQGQYADAETGLYYNRFRYYDPELGRFISPDPIGLRGGLNAYARGVDPTAAVDPVGREEFTPDDPGIEGREAALATARLRFLRRPELMAARREMDKKGPKPDSNKCSEVAEKAQEMGVGGRAIQIDGGLDENGNPKTLTKVHSLDENGHPVTTPWRDHWVNVDPKNPKGIVDVDQGLVWNSKQEMADAMFTHKVNMSDPPPTEYGPRKW